MAKLLTVAALESMRPAETRREVPDGKVPGLFFIMQPSGSRSWAVRYRFDGKPKKFTIGPYPEIDLAVARKRALEALGDIAKGVDPAGARRAAKEAAKWEQRAATDLVESVASAFIERHAKPNTRDWRETERLLRKDVVSAWKGRRLSAIGRADVHALLDEIIDRGAPIGANRTFAQLRKMCRWAVERGIIDRNPCEGLSPPSVERPRDRVLSADELAVVWRAAADLGFPFGPLIRLLCLTGQRREEVGGLRWTEIDLNSRVWALPAERSKNGRPHTVPLANSATNIIATLPRFDGSDYLFSPGKSAPSGYSRAKRRVDAAVAARAAIAPWTFHDIRRSVASGMAEIGIDLHVIERCLNHVSGSFGSIVAVYQKHSFADEMRAGFDAWARHIEALVEGGQP